MGKFMNKLTATDVAEALTYLGSSSQDNMGVMRVAEWSDDDSTQEQEISDYFAPSYSCGVARLDGEGIPTGNYLYCYENELYDPRTTRPFQCSIKVTVTYPANLMAERQLVIYMYFLGGND